MTDFSEAAADFWTACNDAGLHALCSTVLPGCTIPTEFYANFGRPDVNPITGVLSADYEIEYRHADAPTLAEAAEVIVAPPGGTLEADGVMYRVRQAPEVKPEHGMDGTYRCAYLTRVEDCAAA